MSTKKRKREYQVKSPRPRKRARIMARGEGETKYTDQFKNAITVSESTDWTGTEFDPGTTNTLVCPNQGDDIGQRIGRKIAVKKVSIRGVIVNTALADQTDVVENPVTRLIMFVDQQTNGAQAQGEELMQAPGAATTALTYCTFQNINNLGRFRVLKDVSIEGVQPQNGTDGTATVSIACNHVPFKLTYVFKSPLIIRFNNGVAGTVADIVDNSIHLLAQKSGVGYTTNISYQCRGYYYDVNA